MIKQCLYPCSVMHRRYGVLGYRFNYDIFTALFDIDALEETNKKTRWFSLNRWNLISLRAKDHLPAGEQDFRGWIERCLVNKGIQQVPHKIFLLAMPRVLGFVFNPLSVWFCLDEKDQPIAILCEVRNTFGEKHVYLLDADQQWPVRSRSEKVFHVSPFMDLQGDYAFSFHAPNEQLRLSILLNDQQLPKLSATQTGSAVEFSDRQILKQVIRFPFLTAKVLGAIHWHALKLWLKGARFYRKPEPPMIEVSK
jgi:DUF1365 family protein